MGDRPLPHGLFSQSNLGIVVDASIALQARTERSGALFFVLDTDRDVEEATGQIRQLLGAAGQNIGAINVMSRSRVECMLDGSRRMSRDVGAQSLRRGLSAPAGAWSGFGSVYGSREHYLATCQLVRRCLRSNARQFHIYTRTTLSVCAG